MLTALAALSLALAAPAPATPADCASENCVQTGAAQLFALAEQLHASGDLAGAAHILEALTKDKHPELRAEARFRLAAVREKSGDLPGAAQALRDLLAEQPSANPARLELARILARLGKPAEARAEIARAEAAGLPPEVEQNVRRFSSALQSRKRRGLSLDLASGFDNNINRATGDRYVDTIIAPFELDPDARAQSGVGFSFGATAFSRDDPFGIGLLSRAGVHADLFGKSRFNDLQVNLESGPEIATPLGRLRPALTYERRWYGGDPYSTGIGGALNLLKEFGPRTQVEFDASRLHQRIAPNHGQDSWRTSLGLSVSQLLGSATSARLSLRGANLDARVAPESLRQRTASLLLARRFVPLTVFGEVGYTITKGTDPLFLFGKTRRDHRLDFAGGLVFNRLKLSGFAPLVRLTHSNSSANIAIYDYRRTRLDVGLSRSF